MSQLVNLRPRKNFRRQSLELVALIASWVLLLRFNSTFWNWLFFNGFRFDRNKKFPDVLHFFFYDSTKIALLLVGITFVVTIARSFVTIDRTRAFLGGKRAGLGNVFAASLGVVTPFCSCSAVPVFIGFLAAGIPIGITLSFLIASPLINEIAVGLLFSMFGWKIAAIYLLSGLTIAITSGLILGKLRVERWVEPFVFETKLNQQSGFATPSYTLSERTSIGIEESISIIRKIWPYLLAGIALGAIIHGWAPASFFVKYAGAGNPVAVVVAVLVGIPLYSNAAGVIPIVQVLHDKGLPMGTLLAFMMSVVALSLPEMILLRRVLKPKLLTTFVGVVGLGIIFVGYLFNAILH
jgi:uncharacterized membrane protein YraQ (UPF0718 family)